MQSQCPISLSHSLTLSSAPPSQSHPGRVTPTPEHQFGFRETLRGWCFTFPSPPFLLLSLTPCLFVLSAVDPLLSSFASLTKYLNEILKDFYILDGKVVLGSRILVFLQVYAVKILPTSSVSVPYVSLTIPFIFYSCWL